MRQHSFGQWVLNHNPVKRGLRRTRIVTEAVMRWMENIPATGPLTARSRAISSRATERRRAVNSGVTFDLTGESRAIDRSLRTIRQRAASIAGALSLYLKDSRTKVKERERGGREKYSRDNCVSLCVSRLHDSLRLSRHWRWGPRAFARRKLGPPYEGIPRFPTGKNPQDRRASREIVRFLWNVCHATLLREDLNHRVEQRGDFSEDSAGAERLRI